METKLTTCLALITALLTHKLSLAIADYTRVTNASLSSGLSLRLTSSHEGPSYSTRRGSDSFLYLKHSLNTSVASITPIPEDNSGGGLMGLIIGTGLAQHWYILKADATMGANLQPQRACTPERGMEPAGGRCVFHAAGPRGMSDHGENFQNRGKYAGVAALSQSPASLTMQLAARGMPWFSYCLTKGTSRHGFLRFGTDVPHNLRYQATRILPALDASEAAYYVDLVGVSLGERRLDRIHPQMFARGKDGEGGTLIDLGTSRGGEHGAERVERHGYGLCIRVTEVVKGRLQSLSLHFAEEEEATLVISPKQLFLMMEDERAGQITCLAMVPGRRTVIGALQQVDTQAGGEGYRGNNVFVG
ncbi:hypothetical protein HU200_026929 [Digitaria exilis]|uniref:Uncharacterized protein n=1 Tax=Digitaria exilis TaxID=1010633 RepID=A0A835BY08_9POAL|nr:hypothetical protein HU200_026929 [Digitaria exilis]